MLLNARMLLDRPDVQPINRIFDAMKDTSQGVKNAVDTYLDGISLKRGTATNLDAGLYYSEQCLDLIHGVIGGRRFYGRDIKANAFDVFNRTEVPLYLFLQSIVAYAVTSWCFQSHSDEETYYNELVGGDIKLAFEKAFEPTLCAEMRQRIWRQYLDRVVIPNVDSEAHRMAHKVEASIKEILPRTVADRNRFYVEKNVLKIGPSRPAQAAGEDQNATMPPRFKFIESPANVELRGRLSRIFRYALKWRVETSMGIDEAYHFYWADFGDLYDTEEHETADEDPFKGKDRRETRVLVCLAPVIERSIRKVVAENDWHESVVVSKGKVVRL